MKKIISAVIAFAIMAYGGLLSFEEREVLISNSEVELNFSNTNESISPLYTDWDGDGVKDLLVGYWKGQKGFLRFYKNEGTMEEPLFTSWEHVMAGGAEISVPGG